MATYAVMGCTGARSKHFDGPREAIKFARHCARREYGPINVNKLYDRPDGSHGYRTVFRCALKPCKLKRCKKTKRVECAATSSVNASSYGEWERQAKADKYLSGSRKRRGRKSCPASVGKTRAPKSLRRGRR